jgi:hypothetical protein
MTDHRLFGGYSSTIVVCVFEWRCEKAFGDFIFLFLEIHPTVTRPDRVQRKSLSEVIKVHEQLQFAFGGLKFILPLEVLVEI